MKTLRPLLLASALAVVSSFGLAQTITTTSLPTGVVNAPYNGQLTCTNCGTPIWTITGAGVLPPVLSLNPSSGAITGNPTATGTYTFQVTVTISGTTQSASKTLFITVNPALVVTTSSLPTGVVNTNYSSPALAASGGVPPYSWSISTLPPGLGVTVNTFGTEITGVPTTPGTYPVTLTVFDQDQNSATAQLSIVINSAAQITTTSLPNGIVNVSYSAQLTCSACAGYNWAVTGGALPPVLNLSTTGAITGIPSTLGTYDFVVTLRSGKLPPLTQSLSITISPPLTIATTSVPVGTINVPYSTTLAGAGGTPPYTWSYTSTANDGLTINGTTGVISGTPTTAGQFTLGILVTDSGGLTATKLFTLYVASTLSVGTTTLPNGVVGTVYPTQTLVANGGQAPFRWSAPPAALPPGLTLNGTFGTISGTPTATGAYPFVLTVNDNIGNTATANLSITVTGGITITPTSLPGGSVGTPYSQTLTAAGGAAPYTWSIPIGNFAATGTLPAGLTLDPNSGVISGTPTAVGTSTFNVQATDSLRASGSASLSIAIAAATTLTVTTTTLPSVIVGATYSQTLAASGGTAPYSWAVTTGSLPAGLALNPTTGAITGTPTAVANSAFTVTVTDSAKNTAQKALTIAVLGQLSFTPATLPGASVGVAYTQSFTATGGVAPYTFALSGNLPAGFSFSAATATISGTATAAESGAFSVVLTDSARNTVTNRYTLSATVPTQPTATLTGVPASSGFSQQVAAALALSNAYPAPISGTVTLTFAPAVSPATGVDDLMIQFSNGSRTINFTIPAGSATATLTNASSITVLTGTTAGTITLTTTLNANGATLGAPSTQTIVNAAGVPFISSVTLQQNTGGVTVTVVGFSSTRDMVSGEFNFAAASSVTVPQPNVAVALASAFSAWYSNTAQSNAYGTQFTLTVPFNQSTQSVAVVSVTVTLTNSKGTSNAVSLSQ